MQMAVSRNFRSNNLRDRLVRRLSFFITILFLAPISGGAQEAKPAQAMSAEDLMMAQSLVRRLPIGQSVGDAIVKIVRAGSRVETEGGVYLAGGVEIVRH